MKNDTTRLPYFKFMVDKWLAGDIQACEMKTQGVFMNLVALMWRDGGVYSKPIAVLCSRCRLPLAELEKELDMLKELGVIYVDDDGYLRVKFVDEQLGELTQDHDQKVLAGKKGAEKRWGKQTHSTAIAPPCHIDTDKDIDIDNKKAFIVHFEDTWKLYDKKNGKARAQKAYIKARTAGVTDVTIRAGLERYRAFLKSEHARGFGRGWQDGGTWFYNNAWEDGWKAEASLKPADKPNRWVSP
jgi:hypothetical protein